MDKMGRMARHLGESDYSWKNIADKLEEVYQKVIASK